jgi:hypothetical protein
MGLRDRWGRRLGGALGGGHGGVATGGGAWGDIEAPLISIKGKVLGT